MASLRKNKSGKYVVCFRLLGKQFNRELGTNNEKDAEAKRKRIEAIIHEIESGKLPLPDGCFDFGTFVMSDGKATTRPTLPKVVTVQNVIDGYLVYAKRRVGDETHRQYQKNLLRIAARFGKRPAESLTTDEAENYVVSPTGRAEDNPNWSPSYGNGILGSLVSAYKWAVKRGKIIATNPLKGIEKPKKESRGESAVISPVEHAKLCEHADPLFRSYLSVLWHTGARPSEIACLTAAYVDLDLGICRPPQHKLAHLGLKRIICLSPEAVAILRQRIADRPDGLLFPGEDGLQMTAQAIGHRLRRLCAKAKVERNR